MFKASIQLFIALTTYGCTALATQEPVNFVFILLDDVGAGWIPPYAERLTPEDLESSVSQFYSQTTQKPVDAERHLIAARTAMPTLSKLTDSGVVFDRAFATASLCGPSRAGIITGTFQQRWRVYDNTDIEQIVGLPKEFPSLALQLKQAGYTCGMVGKWHVGRKDSALLQTAEEEVGGATAGSKKQFSGRARKLAVSRGYKNSCEAADHPLNNGFDSYFGYNSHSASYYECEDLWDHNGLVPKRPKGEFLTELFNQKAVSFVEGALNTNRPFFLYYNPKSVHTPLLAPPVKYSSVFDTGIQESNEWAGHLRAVDDGIAQLVDLLKEHGKLANTVFVLSSDNGQPTSQPPYNAPFRGGKGTGWIGGLRVPLIIAGAPVQRHGTSSDIVSLADILPTFLDWAGQDQPDHIDGRSLRPFLMMESDKAPRRSLMATGLQASRWTHSTYYGERAKDSRTCPLYAVMIEGDQVIMCIGETPSNLYKAHPKGMPARTWFHDLSTDPQQTKDLSAQHPEKRQSMQAQLNSWLRTLQPPAQDHEGQLEELIHLTNAQ